MTVSVIEVQQAVDIGSVSLTTTPAPGDVAVLWYSARGSQSASTVTGLGGTWTRLYSAVPGGLSTTEVWVCEDPATAGAVTIGVSGPNGEHGTLLLVRGLGSGITATHAESATSATPSATAAAVVGDLVLGQGFSRYAITSASGSPSADWTVQPLQTSTDATRFQTGYSLPAAAGNQTFSVAAGGSLTNVSIAVLHATTPPPSGSVTGTVAAVAPAPVVAVSGDVVGPTTGTVKATAPAPAVAISADVPAPVTGTIAAVAPAPVVRVTEAAPDSATIGLGMALEVGALTLVDAVVLPGTTVNLGMGLSSGAAVAVNILPGTTISLGLTTLTAATPPTSPEQWRYAVTDLDGVWLGDLTDLSHGPVEEGVNALTSMRFQVASESPDRALIRTIDRKLQVWCGERLMLWGPIVPGGPASGNGMETFEAVDPSWWWRDGRRVIGRVPMQNLLKNGDFRQGLNYWTGGYDPDSIPAAAPTSTIVDEDFIADDDGLDPVKALQIVGTESVTQTKTELQSSAVYWPNRPFAWEVLAAGFRPGGEAAIDAVADAMPTMPGLKVLIVGHTANDHTGDGMALSLRRAEAAKARVLAKRPGAIVTTKGVGFYEPNPAYPVDSQQQRRVVISYESTVTVTAQAKQWRKQTITAMQPKSARYPLEMTAQVLAKVADDWSVADANMVTVRVVARRGSATTPWDETKGESSASLSDTDPVERWIPQTASVTIPADGRTYSIDVYLYAAAALTRYAEVGLFAGEMLYFWGVDQALIARGIMEHIQDPAMGKGNLGIETRTPLTGIKRDRSYEHSSRTPADTALYELTALNRGLDLDTLTLPDNRIVLATYYPRLGKVTGHELVQGGNVAAVTPETTRDVASSVIAQAQGLGSYRAEAYARDTDALGGLLLERVVTAEQDTPIYELAEGAKAEVAWGRTTTTGWWLDIEPGQVREVDAGLGKGDTARLMLYRPEPVDRLVRVMRKQRRPGGLRILVALEQEQP